MRDKHILKFSLQDIPVPKRDNDRKQIDRKIIEFYIDSNRTIDIGIKIETYVGLGIDGTFRQIDRWMDR